MVIKFRTIIAVFLAMFTVLIIFNKSLNSKMKLQKEMELDINTKLDYIDNSIQYKNFNKTVPVSSKPVILMWTKYYGVTGDLLLKAIFSGRKWDKNCCSEDQVIITLDRSMLSQASIVVFFNHQMNLKTNDLPPKRSDQIWVLFAKESPTLSLSLHNFPKLFNWTMTYRKDSDIWAPYGYTKSLAHPLPSILISNHVPLSTWISNKSQLLCGLISHCKTQSKRENLIKSLGSLSIPVDIYGRCGNKTICLREDPSCNHLKFWKDLSSSYMFYLAAENSLCVDYITEKFWRTLHQGMVPVVYGGADYKSVAPPNSFINVNDFKSPSELAEYLKWLGNNPKDYAKYFEWRKTHKVILTDGWHGWCELCKKAKTYFENPKNIETKYYQNLADWWLFTGNRQSACKPPPHYAS